MATDLKKLRDELGIGPEVPDSDLRILAKSPALLNHIKSQSRGGGIGGFLSGGLHGLTDTGARNAALGKIESWFTDSLPKSKPTEAAPKKAAPAKPLPTPQQAAGSVQESPYQQLAQALAGEYLQQVNQLMPLTSGSAIPGMTNQVVNEAAAAIPGGGGWLQQQAAAEQKAAAPLFGAMSKVGEAQAQGAIPYANAIANTGTANTQYLEAAPWQQILSELASETAYKAASSQGAAAFGATPSNTPAFLQQIFQNLGLSGTAQGPAGGLQAPGTAAKSGTKNTSTALGTGTSQTG